jgi:hypothetical protein
MKMYQHTQPATTIIRAMLGMIVIFAIASIFVHQVIISIIIIAIITWLFRSLTIEISDTELTWYFGSGFPLKRVPLNEVVSAEAIQTTVWNGWGIHYTARGWLYNVSGRGAVTIKLRNGKQFCLGTDEPEELARHLSGHFLKERGL